MSLDLRWCSWGQLYLRMDVGLEGLLTEMIKSRVK